MRVIVKNLATYSREIQYFRKNQFKVLDPGESFEFKDIHSLLEVSFYESLVPCGFEVKVLHDEKHENCTEEVQSVADREVDLSGFSEDDLKRIVKNLGIETRARARWKLESLVLENLPRDTSPEDYLEDYL